MFNSFRFFPVLISAIFIGLPNLSFADKSVDPDSQIQWITKTFPDNWIFDSKDSDIYAANLKRLQSLEPANDSVQKLKLTVFLKALRSMTPNITSKGVSGITSELKSESSLLTQDYILRNLDIGEYYLNILELSRILVSVRRLSPADQNTKNLRTSVIGQLSNQSGSHLFGKIASYSLCSIAKCQTLNEADQLALLKTLSKFDWNFFTNKAFPIFGMDHLYNGISALRNLQPVSDEVQQKRFELLALALNSKQPLVARKTADALLEISPEVLEPSHQILFLKSFSIDWAKNVDLYMNMKLFQAIYSIEASSKEVKEAQISALDDVRNNGRYPLIAKYAEREIFKVSQKALNSNDSICLKFYRGKL